MAEEITIDVSAYVGSRLDAALAKAYPEFSRQRWLTLIRGDAVTLNGKNPKAGHKISGDEVVNVVFPEVKEVGIIPEDIPLNVVYADDDVIVINKPADLVVHPGIGHDSGTLVNAILYHFPNIKGIGHEIRPGIVHRLDKNTSGLMVVAQNDQAMKHVQDQFRARTVYKKYVGLTEGNVKPPKAMIDADLGRDPHNRKRMAVIPPGSSATSKPAQTTYEVVQEYKNHSLIHCLLHTGRTHQIRVHMAYLGYPLVGDVMYGRKKPELLTNRHFLHSAELGFRLPSTDQEVTFTSPLPEELTALIETLPH